MEENVKKNEKRAQRNPSKISRRGYLKTLGVFGAGLAAGAAIGWFSKPAPSPGRIELNFYTTGHSGFYYDVGRLGWKPIERYMQQNPNIKINTFVDSFFEVYRKETTVFAAGVYAWDVAYMWGALLAELHQYWTPLDEIGVSLPKEVQDDIVPYCKNAVYYKGHWYGLPRMLELFTLMADADVLNAKGLPFPKDWDEFLECCEEVHDPPRRYAFGIGLKEGYLLPPYLTFLHGNGGKLWKDDAMQTVVPDSPESIKAVEDMLYLYENYMNPAAIEKIAFVEASVEWWRGEYVFALYYPWPTMAVTDPESKVKKVYVWLWPGKTGVRSGSVVAAEGYGIPKTAKYKKEAWDFIQYLNSREVQVQMALNMYWKQENEEPVPTRLSYFTDDRLKEYPYNIIVRSQLAALKYRANRYERPHYAAYCAAIEAEIMNALTKKKTPEDAMKDARERCDEILADEYEKFGGGYYDPWPDIEGLRSKIDDLLEQIPVPEEYRFEE